MELDFSRRLREAFFFTLFLFGLFGMVVLALLTLFGVVFTGVYLDQKEVTWMIIAPVMLVLSFSGVFFVAVSFQFGSAFMEWTVDQATSHDGW